MAVSLRQEGERRRRPHLLFVLYALAVAVGADDFNDYRKEVDARFKRIENAAGNIVNRLERLERSPRPQSEKRRRDRFVGKLRFLRRGNGEPDEEREQ